MSIKGSTRFQALSSRLNRQLKEHSEVSFPPDARKSLRKFSMREAADFIKVNPNTFRHYVSSMGDKIPTGELDKSNRRYFTLEEIHEIQRVLFEEGKTDPKIYPRRSGDEPCMVITCFNLKGGSGKTSSNIHISQRLSLSGFRVLLVDSDSQASLTNMFGITPEYDPDMLTLYDMIRYEDPVLARDVIQKTYFPNIDLIPAAMSLMEFEYETALSFRTGARSGAFHTRIANALEPVLGDYDVVVFDTPPQLSFAVIAALFASRGVLIPLNASMLDVMSLASFLAMAGNLMEVVETHAPDHGFDFIKVLITRYEATDQPQVQMASFLRTILGSSVMTTEFVKSTAIGDAGTTKQTVFEVEPREVNKKTYDRAIESISRITEEVEQEIFRAWGRTDGA
jgi:chromosome partitioning protein